MDCPDCGSATVSFAVPPDHQEHVPGSESTVALCTRCLAVHPSEAVPPENPDFTRVSDAFPSNPEGAIALALLVGLLENLALYRSEITDLLGAVEESGTDPLLALDRLDHDPAIETELDIAGRRRQLEQLL